MIGKLVTGKTLEVLKVPSITSHYKKHCTSYIIMLIFCIIFSLLFWWFFVFEYETSFISAGKIYHMDLTQEDKKFTVYKGIYHYYLFMILHFEKRKFLDMTLRTIRQNKYPCHGYIFVENKNHVRTYCGIIKFDTFSFKKHSLGIWDYRPCIQIGISGQKHVSIDPNNCSEAVFCSSLVFLPF